MAKSFTNQDFQYSKFFSINIFDAANLVLSPQELFDFALFKSDDAQTITIPNSTDLPRVQWPIGGYAFWNNEGIGIATAVPADETVLLNDQNAPVEIFDGTEEYTTPTVIVRVAEDDWHIYSPNNAGSGGNVIGTGPTVVNGLAIFGNASGTAINGGTFISAIPGDVGLLTLDSLNALANPAIAIDTSGLNRGALGYDSSDNEIFLNSETILDLIGTTAIEHSSFIFEFNKNSGTETTPIFTYSLNTSGFADQAVFIGTSDPNTAAITANNVGDKFIRADNTSNSGEYINVTGLPDGWRKILTGLATDPGANALTVWSDENGLTSVSTIVATTDFLTFTQQNANSDIGIIYNDNTDTEIARLYWDDSIARMHLDVSQGNTDVDSSVQLNLNANAEFTVAAGLSFSLSHNSGAFINTPIVGQFVQSLVNSGANGSRNDFYCYDTTPEGNLTADFGYSFCWVRDTATPTNSGLWFLNSALANQNTPWVQIASESHTQNGVVRSGSTTDNSICTWDGNDADVIQGQPLATIAGSLMTLTPENPNDAYGFLLTTDGGITFSDLTKALLLQSNTGDISLSAGGDLTGTGINDITFSSQGTFTIENVSGILPLNLFGDVGVLIQGTDTGDLNPAITEQSTGGNANGASSELHIGVRNPKNNITPSARGARYLRAANSDANSNYFIADDITDTGWTALKGGGIYVWGNNGVNSGTTLRFLDVSYNSNQGAGTNEDNVKLYIATGGHFRDFRVTHGQPAGNGNLINYTFAVNGVTQGGTVVALASTGDTAGNTDFIKVERGDYISVHVTKPLSIGSSPNGVKYEASFFPDGS